MLKVLTLSLLLFSNAQAFDHQYSAWTNILKDHVVKKQKQALFKYAKLQQNRKAFDGVIAELEAVTKKQYDKFSREQKLAYLMNTYNVQAIRLVLTKYPISSIKKTVGLFTSTFGHNFFKLFGKDASLNLIEHQILRKDFMEPMIHFGLVCASISCPNIQNEAFTPTNLHQMLEANALEYFSDKTRNNFYPKKKQAKVVELFDWFKEDFAGKFGSLGAFLSKYLAKTKQQKEDFKKGRIEIDFHNYNWQLNDAK